ncbi:MAG: class I SAM-dependent methyltransferase, partial [Planctomycetota bacterium]
PMVHDLERYSSQLARAIELAGSPETLRRWLEDEISDEVVRSAVEQSAVLQPKAVARFGEGLWWCTKRSLMQSTHARVADVKAAWMQGDQVFDLCCGIGGDGLALRCRSRSLTLVDRDPLMVAMAKANLQQQHRPHTILKCIVDDVATTAIPAQAFVHIDPDRRVDGRRNSDPANYSPTWDAVLRRMNSARGGLVKVAPAARFSAPHEFHRAWLSFGGDVREQTLVFGDAIDSFRDSLSASTDPELVTAVVITHQGSASLSGPPNGSCKRVERPAAWMIDPNAAIRAAGLTAYFAKTNQLAAIGGPSGFLTGERVGPADLSISERVVWQGSCDDRKLRRILRDQNMYPARVKTRGVSHDSNELEKRYRKCGQRPITLWIGKGKKRHFGAITVPND